MRKKAELSMNIIIMAIIGLIILAIVAYLIFQRLGQTEQATLCTSFGGECKQSCGQGEFRNFAGICTDQDPGPLCCVPTTTS